MCTAVTYKTKDFYFGRNLDYEKSFNESVVITPRNYKYIFKHEKEINHHYGMIGMACVVNNYPLYFDAVNEKGLSMAGLNYVGNAVYKSEKIIAKDIGESKTVDNIATYEFIPWILSRCISVKEARTLLERINITSTPFDKDMPPAQLHWIIADKEESIVVESEKDGLHVYNNPVGVLTNNPSFKEQIFNLNNYMTLSPKPPENHFSDLLHFNEYSRGMGALGLPGDVSSQSRFVRATFNKMNSKSKSTEKESVAQIFHILGSVEQIRGCNEVADEEYEITRYSACCNANRGIYYYKTYDELNVRAIDMYDEDINGEEIIAYKI
ncbi:MAG: choloylglycine hydrolase family protein [Lachnospiraceae bacterium]|nr:choloylglycine hydrolase family protein [Lachnospiraceae bacterium]